MGEAEVQPRICLLLALGHRPLPRPQPLFPSRKWDNITCSTRWGEDVCLFQSCLFCSLLKHLILHPDHEAWRWDCPPLLTPPPARRRCSTVCGFRSTHRTWAHPGQPQPQTLGEAREPAFPTSPLGFSRPWGLGVLPCLGEDGGPHGLPAFPRIWGELSLGHAGGASLKRRAQGWAQIPLGTREHALLWLPRPQSRAI